MPGGDAREAAHPLHQTRQGPLHEPPRRRSCLGARDPDRRPSRRLQPGLLAPAPAVVRARAVHRRRVRRRVPRHRPRGDTSPRRVRRRCHCAASRRGAPRRLHADGRVGHRPRSRLAAAGGHQLQLGDRPPRRRSPGRAAGSRPAARGRNGPRHRASARAKSSRTTSAPGSSQSRPPRHRPAMGGMAPASSPSSAPNRARCARPSCSTRSGSAAMTLGCSAPINGSRTATRDGSLSPPRRSPTSRRAAARDSRREASDVRPRGERPAVHTAGPRRPRPHPHLRRGPPARPRPPAPRKPRIGDSMPAPPLATAAEAKSDDPNKPARRRRRRGGRGRGGGGGGAAGNGGAVGEATAPANGSRGGNGRARGAGARRDAGPGFKPVEAVTRDEDEPLEIDEKSLKRRRGRERKGRPVGRYFMCVSVRPEVTQIAVLEGRALIEHYVSRPERRRGADPRQHLPRPGPERAAGHGGRVRRHRHAEERRALPRRRPVRHRRRRREARAAPHRAAPQGQADHPLPGHQEPDRPQGRTPHPRGVAARPLRRAHPQQRHVRHLQAPARQRAQAPAHHPRPRPPAGPRHHRAHRSRERDRGGDRARRRPPRQAVGEHRGARGQGQRSGAALPRARHGAAGDP